MKQIGFLLLTFGVIVAAIAFVLPTTVETYSTSSYLPDRVVNIGRLQMQMIAFQSGAALFLAGAIFAAAGGVIEQLRVGATEDSPESKEYPEIADDAATQTAPPALAPEWTDEEIEEQRQRERKLVVVLVGGALLFVALVALSAQIFGGPPASVNALDVAPSENITTSDTMVTNIDAVPEAK